MKWWPRFTPAPFSPITKYPSYPQFSTYKDDIHQKNYIPAEFLPQYWLLYTNSARQLSHIYPSPSLAAPGPAYPRLTHGATAGRRRLTTRTKTRVFLVGTDNAAFWSITDTAHNNNKNRRQLTLDGLLSAPCNNVKSNVLSGRKTTIKVRALNTEPTG